MKPVLVLVSVAILLGSACGGNNAAKPTSTAAPVDPTVVASRGVVAVKAALIGAGDLPAGWTGEPASYSVGELNMSPPCHALDVDGFLDQLAYAKSDRFKGPGGAEIGSEASAFASEDMARQAIDDIRQVLATCHDEFALAITNLGRRSFIEGGGEPSQVEGLSVTIEEISAPPIGDSSFVLRATFHLEASGQVIEFHDDLSTFRSGRLVGTLDFDAGDGDARLHEPLLALAVDRLTKADALMND